MLATAAAKPGRLPYWLSFATVTVALCGLTIAFVLVVLRQRFVLHAGLRESGVSFPAAALRLPSREREWVAPNLAIAPPAEPVTGPERVAGPEPGPSEAFWNAVIPLIETERYWEALPLFRRYLEDHPADLSVRREHAIVLARAGRLAEAEAELRQVLDLGGSEDVRLELARLQRDRRAFDRAVDTYGRLIAASPDDPELRRELALALAWAERYEEALQSYERALELAPDRSDLRLEYARVLFWAGRAADARAVLAGLPADSPELEPAGQLAIQIDSLQASSAAARAPLADASAVERARAASLAGDLAEADRLYAEALREAPDDPDLLREWSDFLQYRVGDLERSRLALIRVEERDPPDAAGRLRLAQLAAWTGREDEALDRLDPLVRDKPEMVEAWLLLGEVKRWRGDRPGAVRAYDRVLALEPADERAETGILAVRELSQAVIDQRESPGVGPVVTLFDDTDEFRQLDVGIRAALQPGADGFSVEGGYRRLEGPSLDPDMAAGLGTKDGAVASVQYVHWWNEATVRTAVRAGVEDLGDLGAKPSFGIDVGVPDLSGMDLWLTYRHGPAYTITQTYASARAELISDRVTLGAYAPLGERWSLWTSGDGASIRGTGADNWRLNGQVLLTRQVSEVFSAGVGTSLLGYTEAAPGGEVGRLYWDPRLFWATGVVLTARTTSQEGLGAHLQVRPGVAVVDERATEGDGLVPQLGLEGGVDYRFGRSALYLNLRYARGREGGYSSFGLELGATIRP
ncbi:MAG: tetratricopeptide repeat protein [Gemmatimonadota bacterium]|jgi:tetratricopeptide (TPR) repeat protein|nr:MAG: tetratricopeptide repeat protein [Gemmatimonadota bacterium]